VDRKAHQHGEKERKLRTKSNRSSLARGEREPTRSGGREQSKKKSTRLWEEEATLSGVETRNQKTSPDQVAGELVYVSKRMRSGVGVLKGLRWELGDRTPQRKENVGSDQGTQRS